MYTVIIAKNIRQVSIFLILKLLITDDQLLNVNFCFIINIIFLLQVVAYNMGAEEEKLEIRLFIIVLLLPLIFMAWVRNLKYLAPVSMIANVFMGLGLGITFYYLVGTGEMKLDNINNMLFKPIREWPEFFSLSIFAMEAIGVVMPLENSMKTPRSMLGLCGVLNKGMSGVSLVYILLGFLGYLRYGEEVKDSITLSLNNELM